ncbi:MULTISPECIES: FAD-dependent tricarballylate dehydrogenase TcuA [Azospirillum]|uniref:FAD-dependent tricarballylate dehydrogenase TcuA n=1 Tax=Azospirillum brasilense TaxID=192 RepID=A0ABU4PHM9_AZOBR|nr:MULTISPECIES: FAD-dependent tricarballylate dehydrogenase TcuA [Azospirillum]ALJ39435.1 hypothetical protein AMK58_28500 [Azospirillum brasilense]MDX5955945.1 FAD-dependent tricarballylate dehydrogenase TcuA [Azospirillum brasilense]PWC88167.1 hypothetical protein AEJ54_24360 [Azospirillum sp. Sp 7]
MRRPACPSGGGAYDVVVIGGGAAALCAALAARQRGVSVLLVEHASPALRGGNARHGRNLRIAHDRPTRWLPERYSEGEFLSELRQATGGEMDEAVAHVLVRGSTTIVDWLADWGVRFQAVLHGQPNHSRRTAFFLGGGKALVNALYAAAERLGIKILYDAEVNDLPVADAPSRMIEVIRAGQSIHVRARAVVAACGGFQANIEWLRGIWGTAADGFVIRGTPYARGQVLRSLLDQGTAPVGDPKRLHMVAVDARSPTFDGGIVTRLDCVPYGIVVDGTGRRFRGEDADLGRTRYAIWGGLLARCPGQIAYSIFDADAQNAFASSVYPPVRADTVAGLAAALEIPGDALAAAICDANKRTGPDARPVRAPPFGAYPLRPGITFSYLGVRVDTSGRVHLACGRATRGLFAAGMIMAPNVLGKGYLAGVALTISAVSGRIAGEEAAAHARS